MSNSDDDQLHSKGVHQDVDAVSTLDEDLQPTKQQHLTNEQLPVH